MHKQTLAIIHTTPVTIASLKELALKHMTDIQVLNFLDDSILPLLGRNGGDLREVEFKLVQYAMYAEQAGADVILNACSSVGEAVERMSQAVSIPVIRIDEAMAEMAIVKGREIGVIATLSTTLQPTLRLLQQKAKEQGGDRRFHSVLADEAYQMLIRGDVDAHDQILAQALDKLGERSDVVVLAQASMARAVKLLPDDQQSKYLTSPELGMLRVKSSLGL